MRRLAKNLILATVAVSAIFLVDLSSAGAARLHYETAWHTKKICPFETDNTERQYMDFWGKFRDTVMPDPDEPRNNNPPKEMEKPKPVEPKPAPPPRNADPKPVN